MVNEKIFLDANILLDVLFDRANYGVARNYILKNDGNLHISALTAHLVTHFGLKILELNVLHKYLDDYYIEDLTAQDVEWALNNVRNSDFEDALQLAVAIRSNCQEFVTFDKTLFNTYKDLATIKVVLLQ